LSTSTAPTTTTARTANAMIRALPRNLPNRANGLPRNRSDRRSRNRNLPMKRNGLPTAETTFFIGAAD
jgi:hypothetical protein